MSWSALKNYNSASHSITTFSFLGPNSSERHDQPLGHQPRLHQMDHGQPHSWTTTLKSSKLRTMRLLSDVEPLSGGQNWTEKRPERHFRALIMLHVLADKLGDLLTANLIMAQIISFSDGSRSLPSIASINLAYASTVEASPLRLFPLDQFIYEAETNYFDGEKLSQYPAEFFRDIAVEYVAVKHNTIPEDGDKVKRRIDLPVSTMANCKYHLHGKDLPNCSSIIRRCFVHLALDM
jgi:hypothetical protein